jgi:transcription antitermination protein NusB
MSRKKAREAAVMLLYHWDMMNYNDENVATTLGETIRSNGTDDDDILKMTLTQDDDTYISTILEGIKTNLATIDSVVEAEAVGWKLGRLPKVDLAILRLGVCELMYRQDIPGAVTINECVDLAKHYSTENSGAFVNGVLSTILKKNGIGQCQSLE